ncbi:MAG: sigma-70 family RNA polymerase sigma factor [Anaerolineales bacterium]|nr:sigma-70 family RNA polymerase sigma factor [Anaerolineales bacterium]
MDQPVSWKGNQNYQLAEDAELVSAAQQNPARFEELYLKWLKPVYRYFYFRLGNVKDAEDLTSQVFLKAYKDLPRYRNQGAFSAWLFSIAHARLVDHYRKGSRKAVRDIDIEQLEIPSNLPGPLSQATIQSEIEQLFSLLKGLTEKEQTLIRLRFIAELSYREIGEILGCKSDTARKSVSRLLDRLKLKMEKAHE